MPRIFIGLFFFPLLVGPAGAQAQKNKPPLRVTLSVDDEDSMVALAEPVVVTATLRNVSKTAVNGHLDWTVHTVAFTPPSPPSVAVDIDVGATKTFDFQLQLPAAGFADVQCRLSMDGHSNTISRRTRIGAEPETLRIPLTRQADFDRFWSQSLDELAQVAPEYEVVPVAQRSSEKLDVFEVTMRSFGSVHVRGWLEVPRGDGTYPAVIRVPGYGSNMRPIGKWNDMIVFSFNPRGHGNSQDEVPGKPANYWIRGLDSKEDYYYRGAYLDCIRAVDYLVTREDVDQNRIAVWGGSQGGGFALATAALDPRVDFCGADIPFLCDWNNYFKLTVWPEMNDWIEQHEARTWETTLGTLSYFDTMNLADRINCPVAMGIGLQDQVCPPTTNFAAFNRVPGEKSYKIYPQKGHGLGKEHWAWMWGKIRGEFQLPTK